MFVAKGLLNVDSFLYIFGFILETGLINVKYVGKVSHMVDILQSTTESTQGIDHLSVKYAINILQSEEFLFLIFALIRERNLSDANFAVNVLHSERFLQLTFGLTQEINLINVKFATNVSQFEEILWCIVALIREINLIFVRCVVKVIHAMQILWFILLITLSTKYLKLKYFFFDNSPA
jgi:hypothetical protein